MEAHFAEKWHSKSIEETVRLLGTDLERGLSSVEAQARLEKYGYNELREQPRPG
ncbi:MAG: hypothetical protein DRI52_10420, partial [Chloroflexi bacterium]